MTVYYNAVFKCMHICNKRMSSFLVFWLRFENNVSLSKRSYRPKDSDILPKISYCRQFAFRLFSIHFCNTMSKQRMHHRHWATIDWTLQNVYCVFFRCRWIYDGVPHSKRNDFFFSFCTQQKQQSQLHAVNKGQFTETVCQRISFIKFYQIAK